jgi:hypothetical protein
LTLTIRAPNAAATTSWTPAIGASNDTRAARVSRSASTSGEVVRVLEDRFVEALEHGLVHRDERGLVLDRQPVATFEVHDVDRAGARDTSRQLARPRRLRVELEAQPG